jgi:hypothetical protein
MKSFRNLLLALTVAAWALSSSPAKASSTDCCAYADLCFGYGPDYYGNEYTDCITNGGNPDSCTVYATEQLSAYYESCNSLYCPCCTDDPDGYCP